MMRGMTAMLVLAACAPVAGQTTPKTPPKSATPIDQSKVKFEFGRAKGDTAMAVLPVTQKEPFTLHFRLGNFDNGDVSSRPDTIAVRTFALRYLSSDQAAKLVGPYVFRSAESAVFDGGSRANAITA
jgi:hypothetical protein